MSDLFTPVHLMILMIVGIGPYFVPTIVAFSRGSTSKVGVLLVNLLLGITVLGWIGALIWASSGETEAQAEAKKIDYDRLADTMSRRGSPPPAS